MIYTYTQFTFNLNQNDLKCIYKNNKYSFLITEILLFK